MTIAQSARGLQFETHTDDTGRLHHLRLIPTIARFRAGDASVDVPFKTQGPDFVRQDIIVRMGGYAPMTWPRGAKPAFDPEATLPLARQIDEIWKKAGAMTIEFVLPEGGEIVAMSESFPYAGDKAAAEFARLDKDKAKMISGGECQVLSD